MKAALYATLIAAFMAAGSPMLSAQEFHGPGNACKADREKFCPDLKPGDGKFGACMKEHEAELSPDCIAARQAGKEAREKIRVSCKPDVEKFCGDAGKDHRAIAKCLESHSSELAQTCADALKSRPGAKKA